MNSQLAVIIVAAMVAGVVLFRLYMVLGRRTGNEPPRQTRLGAGGIAKDNIVPLPERPARAETLDKPADPIARGLLDIQLADRKFDEAHFMTGAKAAYELVVTGFARGDRAALRPLLSDEVYAAFDSVIRERERKKQKVEFTFVGFGEVKITEAALKKRQAEITISFAVNHILATLGADGTVIEGDPKAVHTVNDVWTFSRDVRASDPNWLIIATHGDDAA